MDRAIKRGGCALVGSVVSLLLTTTALGQSCPQSLCAADPCAITGTIDLSDECELDFTGKTVTIEGTLKSGAAGDGFSVRARTLVVHGTLKAIEGTIDVDVDDDFVLDIVSGSDGTVIVNDGGEFELSAGRDVTIEGDRIAARGGNGDDGGVISISAGRDFLLTSKLDVDSGPGNDAGSVSIQARGNVSIQGTISADSSGELTSAGSIEVEAGPSGSLVVSGTIRAETTNLGLSDGEIALGPACSIQVSGTLDALGPPGSQGGAIGLHYAASLDLSGATTDASSFSIHCRCIDSEPDGACDGTCVQDPTGVAQAATNPPPLTEPVSMPACGCGNGVHESALGEECDDGDDDNLNDCRLICILPTCGDGIVDSGEQCDDGNTSGADCCSADCLTPASDGSACDDANECTTSDECQHGRCLPGACATGTSCLTSCAGNLTCQVLGTGECACQ
jgi:cysteine-rich repeat protein